jgi:hypothetical protein
MVEENGLGSFCSTAFSANSLLPTTSNSTTTFNDFYWNMRYNLVVAFAIDRILIGVDTASIACNNIVV